MSRDPRDVGLLGEKEWEEFRASFSAAYLLVWMTEETAQDLLEYAEDLHFRFMSGWDLQANLPHDPDQPDEDLGFPLPPVGGVRAPNWENNLTWMDNSEAHALYDKLFPHRDSLDDFRGIVTAMATIALYSAIETYTRGRGIKTRNLPRSIEDWLSKKMSHKSLDSATMRTFTDLDSSRHILVHNRGIVDDRYIRQVQGTELREGEFRTISHRDLHAFARSVWRVAETIRDV